MSPYRVLAVDKNGHDAVLASMLSKDPTTGKLRIFIVAKQVPIYADYADKIAIAHKMNTCRNSQILGEYYAELNKFHTKYWCKTAEGKLADESEQYTQANCLQAAMHHFCNREKFTILSNV